MVVVVLVVVLPSVNRPISTVRNLATDRHTYTTPAVGVALVSRVVARAHCCRYVAALPIHDTGVCKLHLFVSKERRGVLAEVVVLKLPGSRKRGQLET